jgi:hypothetical protein
MAAIKSPCEVVTSAEKRRRLSPDLDDWIPIPHPSPGLNLPDWKERHEG